MVFFFNDTATTEIYTLSLHDALPISYEDQHGVLTDRDVEAQYLYYNVPVWYALAWDHLRDDVRFFRIDRIRGLQSRPADRKSTRLNSSHANISYAVFCLKKKQTKFRF